MFKGRLSGRVSRWGLLLAAAFATLICTGKSVAQSTGSSKQGQGQEQVIYVCPTGSDDNPGTSDQPVKTPQRAKSLAGSGMAVHFLPPRREVYVSPTGDDANAGTKASPLKSVAKAVAGAAAGTVVNLLPGVHAPFRLKGLSGSSLDPIVLRGDVPLPLDFSQSAALAEGGANQALDIEPIRKALREGKFSVGEADGLAVIDGQGTGGIVVQDCSHLIIENLVVRNGGMSISGTNVTARNCAAHSGGNGVNVSGRSVRLERIVSYGHAVGGFGLDAPEDGQVELVECIAYDNGRRGRQDGKSQGDGFSSGSKRIGRIHMLRCLSLNNWSDGFDFKPGDGLILEFCVGDGNGDLGYGFKDLKIWTGGSIVIRTRATGRVLFVSGTHELRDFKTGVRDAEAGEEQKKPQEAGK
jgi:hypothetical protein